MYTNISNIIDGLIEIIDLNKGPINALINDYEEGYKINVFKGMRKTLPRSTFPSLELEPSSGSNEWRSVRMQSPTYTVSFTLTVATDNDNMGVEYSATLARMFLQLFNNPQNMGWLIPLEISNLPNCGYVQTRIQDAFVDNVTYNSAKDGTFRVINWDWYCRVLESYMPEEYENLNLKPTVFLPHPLPPL